ncbi:hypothetical protein OG830_35635 [Streptomyces sp. NBC_00121]|uniref:hypothetical protein n=1 Tax=unclassified Streptomyces TaxID=2593676 RepID=UPI002DD9138D|nr:hypothetical protein [Streptomyces sp. NBC_01760]WSC73504.1 hypothetical protein OG807_36305 [Streptomyces sp. NBC_01760]
MPAVRGEGALEVQAHLAGLAGDFRIRHVGGRGPPAAAGLLHAGQRSVGARRRHEGAVRGDGGRDVLGQLHQRALQLADA